MKSSSNKYLVKQYADTLWKISQTEHRDFRACLHQILLMLHRKNAQALRNPLITRAQQQSVVDVINKALDVPVIIQRLLEHLVSLKRLSLIHPIAEKFLALDDQAAGILHVKMTTATACSLAQQQHWQQVLQGYFNKPLKSIFNTDPTVIGGIIIEVGNYLIDASIARKLSYLQEHVTGVIIK